MKKGETYVKEKNRKKPVSISISDEEKKKLKREAKKNDMSVSKFVAYMLKGV